MSAIIGAIISSPRESEDGRATVVKKPAIHDVDFKHTISVLRKLCTVVLFYVLASVYYANVEGWTTTDCIYFLTVSISTVGYGDFHPTTDKSRMFTIFVILIGLIFIFSIISDMANFIISLAEEQAAKIRKQQDFVQIDPWKYWKKRSYTAGMVLLLVFIYSDALMICSMQDVVAVLELANQYNLTFLAKKCEGVLVRLVTLDNLCELLDYSDTVNLDTLRTACTAVFLRDVIGVQPDETTLVDFFPDMHHAATVSTSSSKPSAWPNAICTADSHLALEVSKDVALRAELVAAFAQLSPDLRADLYRRVCQDVNVFTSDTEKAGRKVISSDVAVSTATPVGKSC